MCLGRVSEEWILRVILSAPKVSGRALAEAFHLAVGSDGNIISRPTIANIRAAFLEMWKALIFSVARNLIAAQADAKREATGAARAATGATWAATGATRAATGAAPQFVAVHLVHVQDEADIRLLSNNGNSERGLPRRSRSSKVQIHVVRLQTGGQSFELPMDVEALTNKTAPTLATSFERLLMNVLAEVVPPQAHHSSRSHRRIAIWLLHYMVGDGIGTNQAAANILWALAMARQFSSVLYFLLVGKCGTHQACLTAKNGILGRVAAAAAAAAEEANEFENVTATAVRLFKYLVPQSYDDLTRSIVVWVQGKCDVFLPDSAGQPQAAPGSQPQAVRLQALYTQHVIHMDLAQVLYWPDTGSAPRFYTVVKEGEDIAAAAVRLQKTLQVLLPAQLLCVDNHPTLTRFFTFRGCVDRMLTMALLGLPNALEVKSSARESTHKRLKKVRHFLTSQQVARHCVGAV